VLPNIGVHANRGVTLYFARAVAGTAVLRATSLAVAGHTQTLAGIGAPGNQHEYQEGWKFHLQPPLVNVCAQALF